MRVVLVDNRDSFTYNLEQQIRTLGAVCTVVEAQTTSLRDIARIKPTHIVLSPGPGHPKDAILSLQILKTLAGELPILGVCLGHQCMAMAFGSARDVCRAPTVMHGKQSLVYHDGAGLMDGIPSPVLVARYHSLIVRKLPSNFSLLCWTGSQQRSDLIMGMAHVHHPLFGVQFHPESFLTDCGNTLMNNFLTLQW